jgi:hypothetical protein
MIKMLGFRFVSKPYHGWEKGMEAHGDVYESIYKFNDHTNYEADCFYQTNLLKPKFLGEERLDLFGKKYQYILDSQKPFIVSESAPFREYNNYLRFAWSSYGWTDAECNNKTVGNERWNKFVKETNISIKDWKSQGDDIVIMGQKEGDSALTHMYNTYETFYDWVIDVILQIRNYSDRRIVIRPHPRNLSRGVKLATRIANDPKMKNVILSENLTKGGNQGGEGLEADFNRAYCVITFNSLSGVEAVTRGIPVFALDNMSMVWPIAHRDFSQIEKLDYTIDLQQWKNKIAYTMWNRKEVSSGETWAHLKPVYFL